MKPDWELLADEPVATPDGDPAWWRVHVPTMAGALVMLVVAVGVLVGALEARAWRSWVAAGAFMTNAVALVGIARARAMMRATEGGDRTHARLSELGPWGRREWWLTLVAFIAFVVGVGVGLTA